MIVGSLSENQSFEKRVSVVPEIVKKYNSLNCEVHLSKDYGKHLGIEEILETVLKRMGEVKKIMILGDYAEGIDSGHIEILIIGDKIREEYLKEITPKIEKKINRKVSFFVSNSTLKQKTLTIFEA